MSYKGFAGSVKKSNLPKSDPDVKTIVSTNTFVIKKVILHEDPNKIGTYNLYYDREHKKIFYRFIDSMSRVTLEDIIELRDNLNKVIDNKVNETNEPKKRHNRFSDIEVISQDEC
jgi:hypothetical protein